MLFGKDPRLAPIRIPHTATEETPNPNYNPNPNNNASPNDLINAISHEHKNLINIMSSLMLFITDPRLAPIIILDTATEETHNPKSNPKTNTDNKTNINPNHNFNDPLDITSHEHNDLINLITFLMLFGKNPRLADIRIQDTATQVTPNPNLTLTITLTLMT